MSNPMSKEEAAEFAKNFRIDDDDIQEYARPCPNCEYHRKRAQRWREEAYKQSGYPLPERGWVGLSQENFLEACQIAERGNYLVAFQRIQQMLKEKNT